MSQKKESKNIEDVKKDEIAGEADKTEFVCSAEFPEGCIEVDEVDEEKE